MIQYSIDISLFLSNPAITKARGRPPEGRMKGCLEKKKSSQRRNKTKERKTKSEGRKPEKTQRKKSVSKRMKSVIQKTKSITNKHVQENQNQKKNEKKNNKRKDYPDQMQHELKSLRLINKFIKHQ